MAFGKVFTKCVFLKYILHVALNVMYSETLMFWLKMLLKNYIVNLAQYIMLA